MILPFSNTVLLLVLSNFAPAILGKMAAPISYTALSRTSLLAEPNHQLDRFPPKQGHLRRKWLRRGKGSSDGKQDGKNPGSGADSGPAATSGLFYMEPMRKELPFDEFINQTMSFPRGALSAMQLLHRLPEEKTAAYWEHGVPVLDSGKNGEYVMYTKCNDTIVGEHWMKLLETISPDDTSGTAYVFQIGWGTSSESKEPFWDNEKYGIFAVVCAILEIPPEANNGQGAFDSSMVKVVREASHKMVRNFKNTLDLGGPKHNFTELEARIKSYHVLPQ